MKAPSPIWRPSGAQEGNKGSGRCDGPRQPRRGAGKQCARQRGIQIVALSAELGRGVNRWERECPPFSWAFSPEAPVGIEPTNRGFADLCLTTWLRRRGVGNWRDDDAFSTHHADEEASPKGPPLAGPYDHESATRPNAASPILITTAREGIDAELRGRPRGDAGTHARVDRQRVTIATTLDFDVPVGSHAGYWLVPPKQPTPM
jgi:hypothetical protein